MVGTDIYFNILEVRNPIKQAAHQKFELLQDEFMHFLARESATSVILGIDASDYEGRE